MSHECPEIPGNALSKPKPLFIELLLRTTLCRLHRASCPRRCCHSSSLVLLT
ncbi:hypothetical protein DITRI_Ditri12bG0147700 [Diplodiscus trichospermus]